MRNMKLKRAVLLLTLLAMTLSAVTGGTIAWFTDSVESSANIISAGNLDVELYHSNKDVSDSKVDKDTELFQIPTLWEPGAVTWENLTVANEGNLSLYYTMDINVTEENFVKDTNYGLSSVLKVAVVEPIETDKDRDDVLAMFNASANAGTLQDAKLTGALEPGEPKTYGVIIYWEPGENDNNWNVNNGKTVSDYVEAENNNYLHITLGVNLEATQLDAESDAFGPDYDADASGMIEVKKGNFTFYIPKDALAEGGTLVTNASEQDGEYIYPTDLTDTLKYKVEADISVAGLKAGNTVPVTVKYQLPQNDDFLSAEVKHNGEMLSGVKYDTATRIVTFETTSFSPFTFIFDTGAKVIPESYTNDDAIAMLTAAKDGDIIDGNGRTITFADNVTNKWSFLIQNGVTFRNMTLTAKGDGTTVMIYGANKTIKMKNVTFQNTKSGKKALELSTNSRQSLILEDCTIKGKPYVQGTNVTFVRCSFNTNMNLEAATGITFKDCTFTASGAITMNSGLKNILFEKCEFTSASGKTIRLYSGMPQPTNVQLINNTYKGSQLVYPDSGVNYEGWKTAGAWIESGNIKK